MCFHHEETPHQLVKMMDNAIHEDLKLVDIRKGRSKVMWREEFPGMQFPSSSFGSLSLCVFDLVGLFSVRASPLPAKGILPYPLWTSAPGSQRPQKSVVQRIVTHTLRLFIVMTSASNLLELEPKNVCRVSWLIFGVCFLG